MLASTKGIVLRNTKYSDNKNIVTVLTADYGKMPYMVYAVHSKRAALRGSSLQVLSVLELQVEHRSGKTLQRIKDARRLTGYPTIYSDPCKSAFAFFAAEVVDKCIYEPEKDREIFDFLDGFAAKIDSADKITAYDPHEFLLQLSVHLGFFPYDEAENDFFALFRDDDGAKLLLQYLQGRRNLTRQERREVLHALLIYYKHHLPAMGKISSLEVLESFFSL